MNKSGLNTQFMYGVYIIFHSVYLIHSKIFIFVCTNILVILLKKYHETYDAVKLFENNNFLKLQIDATADGISINEFVAYKILYKNDLRKL